VRIYFGIRHNKEIQWPDRCLWCGNKSDKWHIVSKKSIYDFEYRVFWYNILSRIRTIAYPVCKKHDIIAFILTPFSRIDIPFWALCTAIGFFLAFMHLSPVIEQSTIIWWYLICSLIIVGFLFFDRRGLQVHKVTERFTVISIPDGEYATEFGLLNNCNTIDGRLLMQQDN
jgi:hypothetical protein